MVQVKEIATVGAYVRLLEYGNIEGMILLSELSRRRIRSINKLIRVGKNEAVMVLRVDKEKGYIDLSKRRVSQEEIAKCEEKYNKSKQTAGMIRQMIKKTGKTEMELNQMITWPLYVYESCSIYLSIYLPACVYILTLFPLPPSILLTIQGPIRQVQAPY